MYSRGQTWRTQRTQMRDTEHFWSNTHYDSHHLVYSVDSSELKEHTKKKKKRKKKFASRTLAPNLCAQEFASSKDNNKFAC